MKTQSQIDDALSLIGNAQPPSGLERRVLSRLYAPRRGATAIHFVSAAAIAASMAIAAVTLAPALRDLRGESAGPASAVPSLVPRATARPKGDFGAASAVHLPTAPVKVQPSPVNQGRGHARSARTIAAGSPRAHMPHGVAVPRRIRTRISPVPVASIVPATSIQRVASAGH